MSAIIKKVLGFKKIFGSGQTREHLQRSSRVRIPLMDNSVFVVTSGEQFPIRNLSESGMAIGCVGGKLPSVTKGEIRVAGQSAAVEFLLVRQNGDEAGVKFLASNEEVRRLLRRVFVDEINALGMTEVDSSRQKIVELGKPRWFYAPGNYELFFVEHDSRVIRFEMEWNGNFLAYTDGKLRAGRIDDENREEVAHARSSLVKWLDDVSGDQKIKALRLLENIPGLEAEPRQRLQEILRG